MSDIVHWLNKLAALVDEGHEPRHVVAHMRAAAAEIERLRAALERIVNLDDEWVPETQDDYTYSGYQKCADIARAALEGK